MSLTNKELFDRLVVLESDKLTTGEDIKQIKSDCKYDEDINPGGLEKEEIALIHAAAKLEAKRNFEEVSAKAAAVSAKYKEMTGYDD